MVEQHDATERLEQLLRAVCEGFGIDDAQIDVAVSDGGDLEAQVTGEGTGELVGEGGEVIDAIQYLASQVVGRSDTGRRRVNIDADGYRARREAMLVALAGRAADEALEYEEEIELDPMTPHDRRIVHMALKERSDIETRSEGDEPRRRIIVQPADG